MAKSVFLRQADDADTCTLTDMFREPDFRFLGEAGNPSGQ